MLIPGLTTRLIQPYVPFGVTAIDPSSLPGWELALRADQVVGANGAGAASLPDISGHARHAAQANGAQQPLITDGASPGGKRMLLYDGVDDQMEGNWPAIPPGIPNTDGYTIYIYFQEAALSTGGFNSQLLFGGPLEMVARTATIGGYPSDQHYGMAFVRQSLGATALGFQSFVGVWTTGASPTMKGYVNGAQSGSTLVWNDATLGNGFTIGSNATGVVSLSGLFGSCDVFSHAHSLATVTGVLAYFTNYWE